MRQWNKNHPEKTVSVSGAYPKWGRITWDATGEDVCQFPGTPDPEPVLPNGLTVEANAQEVADLEGKWNTEASVSSPG